MARIEPAASNLLREASSEKCRRKATMKATAIDRFLTGVHFCHFPPDSSVKCDTVAPLVQPRKEGGLNDYFVPIADKTAFEVHFLDNAALQP
jgi:hypothetical protein